MKRKINYIFKQIAPILIACFFGLLILYVDKINLIMATFFVMMWLLVIVSKSNSTFSLKVLVYFIILSIPFPLLFQVFGKDAITLTTVLIFIAFFIFILSSHPKIIISRVDKVLILCPLFLSICFTLTIFLNPVFLGQSFRYYIANLSGILLFFLIVGTFKAKNEIILLLKFILWMLAVQSFIAFLQLKFPTFSDLILEPFRTRTLFGEAPIVENILRSTGTMWDYELLAEWFLIGVILSLALTYELQKKRYLFFTIANLIGIAFTKTRSDVFLTFALLAIIFLLIFKKGRRIFSVKMLFIIGSLSLLASFLVFPEIKLVYDRLLIYVSSGHLLSPEAINRKAVWDEGFRSFLATPTLFGKGFYNIESLGIHNVGSFHSLYLTLLYKTGIVTFLVYLIFWLRMLSMAWGRLFVTREISNWYTLFFLFISVIFMLVDNFKIEYMRYAHTIQFAWLLYALLVVSIRGSTEDYENTLVS